MGALVKALVLYKGDEPGSAGDENLALSGKRLRLDVAVARTTGRTPRPDQLGPRPGQPAQPGHNRSQVTIVQDVRDDAKRDDGAAGR